MKIDVRNEKEFMLRIFELVAEHALTEDNPEIIKGSNGFTQIPEVHFELTGLHILVRDNLVLISYKEEDGKLQHPIVFTKMTSPIGKSAMIPIDASNLYEVWEKHPPTELNISKELEELLK